MNHNSLPDVTRLALVHGSPEDILTGTHSNRTFPDISTRYYTTLKPFSETRDHLNFGLLTIF